MEMNIKKLSLDDKIKLVEDIWDSIAADQSVLLLPDHQKLELEKRLQNYSIDGDPGSKAIESIEKIRSRL